MGGVLGTRDNEERSMLSWRDRYALPTNPTNKRNSIPNIDEVPLNLSEDAHPHDSTPTKSPNTNNDVQQNAAGSPLSIGIIGIQAFSNSSQKRNVKFENNHCIILYLNFFYYKLQPSIPHLLHHCKLC